MVVGTPEVITPENFGGDRVRHLGAAGVKFYPFPLTLIIVLTTLALPCECVILLKPYTSTLTNKNHNHNPIPQSLSKLITLPPSELCPTNPQFGRHYYGGIANR